MTGLSVTFRWCRCVSEAARLAVVIHRNLSDDYISHGELRSLRAHAPGVWADDIAGLLEADVMARVDSRLDAPPDGSTTLAVTMEHASEVAGAFLVAFHRNAAVPYCVVEDAVVDLPYRGRGCGKAFMRWMEAEAAARGIRRIFTESGHRNGRAHVFFRRLGFSPVSLSMMREF